MHSPLYALKSCSKSHKKALDLATLYFTLNHDVTLYGMKCYAETARLADLTVSRCFPNTIARSLQPIAPRNAKTTSTHQSIRPIAWLLSPWSPHRDRCEGWCGSTASGVTVGHWHRSICQCLLSLLLRESKRASLWLWLHQCIFDTTTSVKHERVNSP